MKKMNMKTNMNTYVRIAIAVGLVMVLLVSTIMPLMAAQIDLKNTYFSDTEATIASLVRLAKQTQRPNTPTGGTIVTIDTLAERIVIEKGGNYVLSGRIEKQIVVSASKNDVVTLVLDNVELISPVGPALEIISANRVDMYVKPQSINSLTDTVDSKAALFSKTDFRIYGSGTLNVNGRSDHGIKGNDDVAIFDTTLNIVCLGDGIKGTDSIVVVGATISITAEGDGMQSDNEDDPERGYMALYGSTLTIMAAKRGLQAETLMLIDGGTIKIQAMDDAIHSNDTVHILGGTITLTSGDDAVHADNTIIISGGELTILSCYEGLEANAVGIFGGTVHIKASDDGINTVAPSGNTTNPFTTRAPGGFVPDNMGMDRGGFESSDGSVFVLSDGYVYVDAEGDGIDVNGGAYMTGGVLIISGPVNSGDGALDWTSNFTITGGTIVATGSSGMAQGIGNDSTQYGVLINLPSTQKEWIPIAIIDKQGNPVIVVVPNKSYASLVYSSSQLTKGESYSVFTGGTVFGSVVDGIATDATYSNGVQTAEFTATSIAMTVGNQIQGIRGGMGMSNAPDNLPPRTMGSDFKRPTW